MTEFYLTECREVIYVHHFRMRNMRRRDIHTKRLPVHVLCRTSHDQAANRESGGHDTRVPEGGHSFGGSAGQGFGTRQNTWPVDPPCGCRWKKGSPAICGVSELAEELKRHDPS